MLFFILCMGLKNPIEDEREKRLMSFFIVTNYLLKTFAARLCSLTFVSLICQSRHEAELLQAASQPLPDEDDDAFD